eukprot:gene46075-57454_t
MKQYKMNHRINALFCAAAIGAFAMVGCKDSTPDTPATGAGSSESGVAGGTATSPGTASGTTSGTGFHHPDLAPACALTIGNFDGVH